MRAKTLARGDHVAERQHPNTIAPSLVTSALVEGLGDFSTAREAGGGACPEMNMSPNLQAALALHPRVKAAVEAGSIKVPMLEVAFAKDPGIVVFLDNMVSLHARNADAFEAMAMLIGALTRRRKLTALERARMFATLRESLLEDRHHAIRYFEDSLKTKRRSRSAKRTHVATVEVN
jgi:hypothetical protein